jgi:hypothetical protein
MALDRHMEKISFKGISKIGKIKGERKMTKKQKKEAAEVIERDRLHELAIHVKYLSAIDEHAQWSLKEIKARLVALKEGIGYVSAYPGFQDNAVTFFRELYEFNERVNRLYPQIS